MPAGPTVVRPEGEIDLASVDSFRQAVQVALATEPADLVLDLRDVTFLDSSGLSVLALALKGQRSRDASVSVVNSTPIVRRAIDLVGLGLMLEDPAPSG